MIPNTLPDIIADLYGRVGDIERRARNRKRTGTIEEVGTGDNAGLYRVKLSEQDGKPFLTDWLKTRQMGAAGVKIDVMLTQGEQVDVISESGDLTDAQIDLSTYSDQNKRANTDSAPLHIKIDDTVHVMTSNSVHTTSQGITFTASSGHLN
jgi:phage baseplate assembly protein gpV